MHKDTAELNQLLLGQHMAIDSLRDYINGTDNTTLRGRLEEMLRVHEVQAEELSEHVRSLGDSPEESRGMAGVMRTAKTRFRLSLDDDEGEIIKALRQGEEMGIEEELKCLQKLSSQSRPLVEKHITENRSILERLH